MNDNLGCKVTQHYHVECYGPNGRLKWSDGFDNLVTTEGLNEYLNVALAGGTQHTSWYIGLIKSKTTGAVAGDTLLSHDGWTEAEPGTDYTGDRPEWTKDADSTLGAITNSASPAVFPILTEMTAIPGAFMCSATSGTSGVLLGVGDFAGGNKSVSTGDTLRVTVSCSMTTG